LTDERPGYPFFLDFAHAQLEGDSSECLRHKQRFARARNPDTYEDAVEARLAGSGLIGAAFSILRNDYEANAALEAIERTCPPSGEVIDYPFHPFPFGHDLAVRIRKWRGLDDGQ
jgi:hypothetical protein